MRLFDCSCHFPPFISFFFFAAAGGGFLSGDAIYGIDDQVSMSRIWQFSELVSDITARKREISTLPK